jgi:hypothetical protein
MLRRVWGFAARPRLGKVLGYATPASASLLQRLDKSKEEAVATLITLEEQMRGWLAAIHNQMLQQKTRRRSKLGVI